MFVVQSRQHGGAVHSLVFDEKRGQLVECRPVQAQHFEGAVFGLMHWGLSVGVLAALPTSLLIGLGSVAWGKYALDTRGLSWVIVAHALIDVAVMSAYFVPKG